MEAFLNMLNGFTSVSEVATQTFQSQWSEISSFRNDLMNYILKASFQIRVVYEIYAKIKV